MRKKERERGRWKKEEEREKRGKESERETKIGTEREWERE